MISGTSALINADNFYFICGPLPCAGETIAAHDSAGLAGRGPIVGRRRPAAGTRVTIWRRAGRMANGVEHMLEYGGRAQQIQRDRYGHGHAEYLCC